MSDDVEWVDRGVQVLVIERQLVDAVQSNVIGAVGYVHRLCELNAWTSLVLCVTTKRWGITGTGNHATILPSPVQVRWFDDEDAARMAWAMGYEP